MSGIADPSVAATIGSTADHVGGRVEDSTTVKDKVVAAISCPVAKGVRGQGDYAIGAITSNLLAQKVSIIAMLHWSKFSIIHYFSCH